MRCLLGTILAPTLALAGNPALAQAQQPDVTTSGPSSPAEPAHEIAAQPQAVCAAPPAPVDAATAGTQISDQREGPALGPPVDSPSAPLDGTTEHCVFAPVRPPPPDIFGLAAAPIGTRVVRQDWQGIRTASLKNLRGPWDEMLAQTTPESGRDPLDAVNRWVNWHVRFERDRLGDEWSSAPSTLVRGFGDCEDFAIAKMALLERLGVAADTMFLVLVRERLRPVDHAVLAVRRGDRMLVLDNRTDHVIKAEEITDYQPTLGFGGSFAWIYGQRIGKRDDSATESELSGAPSRAWDGPTPAH